MNGTPAGLSLDFGTDEVGNIVGLTVGAAANNRVYDYDDLNRLTSVVNGSTETGTSMIPNQPHASVVPCPKPKPGHP